MVRVFRILVAALVVFAILWYLQSRVGEQSQSPVVKEVSADALK